jgi:protein-tyrosine-phosphatase
MTSLNASTVGREAAARGWCERVRVAARAIRRVCSRPRRRVLFLRTGNSTRSQIAEALLGQVSEGTIGAASAGSKPRALHPNAVRVMKKRGVDMSANRTRHLDEFVAQRFDVVITLCDRIRKVGPEFPSHPDLVHWRVPNPALDGPNDGSTLPLFERTPRSNGFATFRNDIVTEPGGKQSCSSTRQATSSNWSNLQPADRRRHNPLDVTD